MKNKGLIARLLGTFTVGIAVGVRIGYRRAFEGNLTRANRSLEIAYLCQDLMQYMMQNIDNDNVSQEEYEQVVNAKRAFIEAIDTL